MYNVKLYPEEGETTTILNIKRGIVSALAVPLMEEDKIKNMVHSLTKKFTTSACVSTNLKANADIYIFL